MTWTTTVKIIIPLPMDKIEAKIDQNPLRSIHFDH